MRSDAYSTTAGPRAGSAEGRAPAQGPGRARHRFPLPVDDDAGGQHPADGTRAVCVRRSSAFGALHPGRSGAARPPRGRVPALRAPLPRPHHADSLRGLDGHPREGVATPARRLSVAHRALLGNIPGVRGGRARGGPSRRADLLPREDGRGLLQVPEQDRARRRPKRFAMRGPGGPSPWMASGVPRTPRG